MGKKGSRFLTLLISLMWSFHAYPQQVEAMSAGEELGAGVSSDEWKGIFSQSKLLRENHDSTALQFSQKALALTEKNPQSSKRAEALLEQAENLIEFSRYKAAIAHLDLASKLPGKSLSRQQEGRTLQLYGVANNMQANYKLAGFYLEKSKAIFEAIASREDAATVYNLMAVNHRYRGNYQESAEYRYKALDFFEQVEDSARIVECLDGIGILHFLQGENEKAIEVFNQNLGYYQRQKDSISLGFAYTLMGLATYGLGEYDQSLEYNQKSLLIRQKINDVRGIGESYNNLALAHMGRGQWDQASAYLEKAREFLIKGNDLRQIPVITGNLAHARLMLGDKKESIRLYKEAIDEASRTGLRPTLTSIYKRFPKIYVDEGDYESAYECLLKYIAINDSLFDQEKVKAINELKIEYDVEKKEQEIEMLRKKQELLDKERAIDQRKWLAMGSGLGMIIIILFLTVSRQRLKIRKDALLHDQEKTLLQTREALTSSELRNTRQSLEHHRQQLMQYTESIHQKNKMLDELEGKLKNLEVENQQAEADRNSKVNELLEMRILTDEDWDEFRRLFEQVHTGLTLGLREQFPTLTVGETRLFMLLRLQFSSREIARSLGVSPDSVKKGRYRLRKKLELVEGQDLQEFVSNFEPKIA